MPSSDPGKKPPKGTENEPTVEEQIRQRAYELYEERGREDGHELDDWLRAEGEFTRKARTIAA